MNIQQSDMLFRSVTMDAPDESGVVALVFSTETKENWRKYDGQSIGGKVREVLLHTSDAVNLSRLAQTGAVLLNHDPTKILGKVVNARLDGKQGRAEIIFDPDNESQSALGKIRSGSLRGVSVGYKIDAAIEVQPGKSFDGIDGPALVATRWTPFEISLTPIPADLSAKIGRSADGGIITIAEGEQEMNREEVQAIAVDAAKLAAEEAVKRAVEALKPAPETPPQMAAREDVERLRVRAEAMGGDFPALVLRGVADGKTVLQIQEEMLDAQSKRSDAKDTGGANPGGEARTVDTDTFSRSIAAGLVR